MGVAQSYKWPGRCRKDQTDHWCNFTIIPFGLFALPGNVSTEWSSASTIAAYILTLCGSTQPWDNYSFKWTVNTFHITFLSKPQHNLTMYLSPPNKTSVPGHIAYALQDYLHTKCCMFKATLKFKFYLKWEGGSFHVNKRSERWCTTAFQPFVPTGNLKVQICVVLSSSNACNNLLLTWKSVTKFTI